MEDLNKQMADYLIESDKLCRNAGHLIYVTYPVVRDKTLLLKALENSHKSAVKIISLILKQEYLHKRIQLYKDSEKNLKTFFEKCAKTYYLSDQEIGDLKNLMELAKKYKESTLEFPGHDKAVMLGENGKIAELSLDAVKNFIKILRKLIEDASKNLKNSL